MTVILDYGMGNLRSVERALAFIGFPGTIQTNLKGATRLIIPGVGAFEAAMANLAPIVGDIQKFAADGRPVLGICLGQQLLFDWSEEDPRREARARPVEGLGLLRGGVRYFSSDMGLKVPHMGWNRVDFRPGARLGDPHESPYAYFVHSLYTEVTRDAVVAAETDYGITFASAVESGNVFGLQFHPEKSGAAGLRMLERFCQC